MANIVNTPGPAGNEKNFEDVALGPYKRNGRLEFKYADNKAFDAETGTKLDVPSDALCVVGAALTVNLVLENAVDVPLGEGYWTGGVKYERVDGGVIQLDPPTFQFIADLPDNGDVRIGASLTINPDD